MPEFIDYTRKHDRERRPEPISTANPVNNDDSLDSGIGSMSESESLPSPKRKNKSIPSPTLRAKSVVSSATSEREGVGDLLPIERHYLNKALIALAMQREWSAQSQVGELTKYGSPFQTSPAIDASLEDDTHQPYVLRYLFQECCATFPGLQDAPREYWTDHAQRFWDNFASKNLSSSLERGEVTKRRMLAMSFTRILSSYMNVVLVPTQTSVPSRPPASILRRIEDIIPGSMQDQYKSALLYTNLNAKPADVFPSFKPTILEHDADSFQINVRSPQNTSLMVIRSWQELTSLFEDLEVNNTEDVLRLPLLPLKNAKSSKQLASRIQYYLRSVSIALYLASLAAPDSEQVQSATTRFSNFLTHGAKAIAKSEQSEIAHKVDQLEDQASQERQIWVDTGVTQRKWEGAFCSWRRALSESDEELNQTFRILRTKNTIMDAPRRYIEAEMQARVWMGNLLHFIFVSGEGAAERISILKSFVKLVPWTLLRQGSKFVSPAFAIRTIVNILLASPFGSYSILQRIIAGIVKDQQKSSTKDVAAFEKVVTHEQSRIALKDFVYTDKKTQQAIRSECLKTGNDIVLVILKRSGIDGSHIADLESYFRAYNKSTQSGKSATLPPDGETFKAYKDLLRAYCTRRDAEQVLAIAYDKATPAFVRQIIETFYPVIFGICEATDLPRALGDLQAFLSAVVSTCSATDNGVPAILKMIDEHEPKLWLFLHELAMHGSLLLPYHQWATHCMVNIVGRGIPNAEPPNESATRFTVDYDALIAQIKPSLQAQIVSEVRALADWSRFTKATASIRTRCDLMSKLHGIQMNSAELCEMIMREDRYAKKYIDNQAQSPNKSAAFGWAYFAQGDITHLSGHFEQRTINKKKSKSTPAVKEEISHAIPFPPFLKSTEKLLPAFMDTVKDALQNYRVWEQKKTLRSK